jgi:hypothetical protein
MARKDKGHYAKKHPSDRKIDQKVAEAVKGRVSEEEISCAAAFKIVSDLEVSPLEVGFTIDVLEIPVTKCQLGLFGYNPQKGFVQPAESVSSALEWCWQNGCDRCLRGPKDQDHFLPVGNFLNIWQSLATFLRSNLLSLFGNWFPVIARSPARAGRRACAL